MNKLVSDKLVKILGLIGREGATLPKIDYRDLLEAIVEKCEDMRQLVLNDIDTQT